MLAVTSFPERYNEIAERFLHSFVDQWPCRIVAYHEGQELFEHPQIEYRNLHDVKDFDKYIERIKRVAGSDGNTPEGFDFRYNANAYCRKVFAQNDVFDRDSMVFWLDADSLVKKPVPEEFLRGLFNGAALCFLGRALTYTETGFVGFQTTHPEFAKFRQNYLPYFTSGKIFGQLKGWHDCIAFDYARQGVLANNLSPGGKNYDPVMEQSVLAEYLDHLKGQRKNDPDMKPRGRWK